MAMIPPSAIYRVRVRVLPAREGGRTKPIHSGYRCNFWIGHVDDGRRTYNDGAVFWEGSDEVVPGEVGLGRVQPTFPKQWLHLQPGSEIELCEGPNVVGVAEVVEVLR